MQMVVGIICLLAEMTFCKRVEVHFILYYPEEFAYNRTKNNQFQDSIKSPIGRNDRKRDLHR